MISVAKNEFLNLIKSVKAVIVILVFVLFSFYISNFLIKSSHLNTGKAAAYSSLRLLVFVLGYLFASILSHNTINREIEQRTGRLIVTKISRKSFLLGKFIGNLMFWFVSITVSYILISIMSNQQDGEVYFMTLSTMIYFVGLVLLLSTAVNKTSMSNFLGVFLGIAIPGIGIWITLDEKHILGFTKYIFPYFYILKGGAFMLIPDLIAIIWVIIALIIIKRKEL